MAFLAQGVEGSVRKCAGTFVKQAAMGIIKAFKNGGGDAATQSAATLAGGRGAPISTEVAPAPGARPEGVMSAIQKACAEVDVLATYDASIHGFAVGGQIGPAGEMLKCAGGVIIAIGKYLANNAWNDIKNSMKNALTG